MDYITVSGSYWPPLDTESATTFKHHPIAQTLLEQYRNAFVTVKKPRKLEVVPHLGNVSIDLEFDDGTTREFSVSPIQVLLLQYIKLRYVCDISL